MAVEEAPARFVPLDVFANGVAAVHECLVEGKVEQAFLGLRALEEAVGKVRRERDARARRQQRARMGGVVEEGDERASATFATQQEMLGALRGKLTSEIGARMRAAEVSTRSLRMLWRLASALGDESSAQVFCDKAMTAFEERAVSIRRHLDTVRSVRLEATGSAVSAGSAGEGDGDGEDEDEEQPFETALFEVLSTALAWMEAPSTSAEEEAFAPAASTRAQHRLAASMHGACDRHASAMLQLLRSDMGYPAVARAGSSPASGEALERRIRVGAVAADRTSFALQMVARYLAAAARALGVGDVGGGGLLRAAAQSLALEMGQVQLWLGLAVVVSAVERSQACSVSAGPWAAAQSVYCDSWAEEALLGLDTIVTRGTASMHPLAASLSLDACVQVVVREVVPACMACARRAAARRSAHDLVTEAAARAHRFRLLHRQHQHHPLADDSDPSEHHPHPSEHTPHHHSERNPLYDSDSSIPEPLAAGDLISTMASFLGLTSDAASHSDIDPSKSAHPPHVAATTATATTTSATATTTTPSSSSPPMSADLAPVSVVPADAVAALNALQVVAEGCATLLARARVEAATAFPAEHEAREEGGEREGEREAGGEREEGAGARDVVVAFPEGCGPPERPSWGVAAAALQALLLPPQQGVLGMQILGLDGILLGAPAEAMSRRDLRRSLRALEGVCVAPSAWACEGVGLFVRSLLRVALSAVEKAALAEEYEWYEAVEVEGRRGGVLVEAVQSQVLMLGSTVAGAVNAADGDGDGDALFEGAHTAVQSLADTLAQVRCSLRLPAVAVVAEATARAIEAPLARKRFTERGALRLSTHLRAIQEAIRTHTLPLLPPGTSNVATLRKSFAKLAQINAVLTAVAPADVLALSFAQPLLSRAELLALLPCRVEWTSTPALASTLDALRALPLPSAPPALFLTNTQ